MLKKIGFQIFNLFPKVEYPLVEDFTKKSYFELREYLLADDLSDHATLIIGRRDLIQMYVKEDFKTFINVEEDQGKVNSTLDQNAIYFLSNLKLARSIDFRPDGNHIKGIVLLIVTPAPVWRNYQQWLGRVGRHGDKCRRLRICSEIGSTENAKYVSKLKLTQAMDLKEIQKFKEAKPKISKD